MIVLPSLGKLSLQLGIRINCVMENKLPYCNIQIIFQTKRKLIIFSHLKIKFLCRNMVKTHQSDRSCETVLELFKRMFKTDLVVQKFKMKKDKARYCIIYGIFPSLQATVIKNIHKARWYCVYFDESFNHDKQMCQMDIIIWYMNEIRHIVRTIYLTSQFLLRPNAENIKDELFAWI